MKTSDPKNCLGKLAGSRSSVVNKLKYLISLLGSFKAIDLYFGDYWSIT